ncbi:DUF5664 domain-containing protein [bacterium]|nr:DUF5664 domain-containing protein [bacterium]
MTNNEQRVWKYLVENRGASTHKIAKETDTTVDFVDGLLARISSPNWREEVSERVVEVLADVGLKFVKSDDNKSRYDLLPPEMLEETAQVLAFGAQKYSDNNWVKGASWSRYFSAMMRHMWAWWRGEDNDPETGYSHLAHAACCLGFLMAYQRRGIGKDDRLKGGV